VPDIYLLPIKVDRCNQTVLVPADVKDNISPDLVCAGKDPAQLVEAVKLVSAEDAKPDIKGRPAVRMRLRKFA
jgi:hypothetical protein